MDAELGEPKRLELEPLCNMAFGDLADMAEPVALAEIVGLGVIAVLCIKLDLKV